MTDVGTAASEVTGQINAQNPVHPSNRDPNIEENRVWRQENPDELAAWKRRGDAAAKSRDDADARRQTEYEAAAALRLQRNTRAGAAARSARGEGMDNPNVEPAKGKAGGKGKLLDPEDHLGNWGALDDALNAIDNERKGKGKFNKGKDKGKGKGSKGKNKPYERVPKASASSRNRTTDAAFWAQQAPREWAPEEAGRWRPVPPRDPPE
jgi:hypothetical protein